MSQQRWDIAIKILNGPLSGRGEQVLRGPVVRLGANPGPGGVQLTGYRGLDARQCVITAYKGGSAAVAPVGANQVRVAPHANVKWKEIDPVPGPVYLTENCAIHLGPVGRGATIEFIECRRFGTWERGQLASEVARPSTGGPAMAGARGAVPQSFDARKVGTVHASSAPIWFMGCLFLLMGTTFVLLLGIGGYRWATVDIVSLGPVEEGYEFYESVDLTRTAVDPDLYQGLEKPFFDFVMRHNQAAAGTAQTGLDKPENWDTRFLQFTTAQLQQQAQAWSIFRTLDQVRTEYSDVVLMLREADLPEVFAAIPYQESRYFKVRQPSVVCAMGFWQIMPEVALRVERTTALEFRVRDCSLQGVPDYKWNPTALAPPKPSYTAEYVMVDNDEKRCLIERCDVDDRTDLKKSTRAAIHLLTEAYEDSQLRRSGSAVQITIASHNAGYDDSRFGLSGRNNLKAIYEAWADEYGESEGPHFYGRNILTTSHLETAWNGSKLHPETQHYVYSVVAQHLLAVCYYASNYPEDRAFSDWTHNVTDADGYCRQFAVPSASDVRSRTRGTR